MSRQFDQIHEETIRASLQRVTALELAHAMAAIEESQEAEDHRNADTISIGEAIEQLGLCVTPDELLAAVQAQRQVRAINPENVNIRQRHNRKWTILNMVIMLSVIGNLLLGALLIRISQRPELSKIMSGTGSAHGAVYPQYKRLSNIVDGEPFYCDNLLLTEMISGPEYTDTSTKVEVSPGAPDLWTVTRSSGQFVLKAWMSGEQALAYHNGSDSIVASRTGGAGSTPISVPVNRVGLYNGVFSTDEVIVRLH